MVVLFGAASGQPDPLNVALLAQKGSVFLTRPSLHHYSATKEEFQWRATEVFEWVKSGIIKIVATKYPLANVQQAHKDLEGRAIIGKVLLLV
jgi:NADPH2:quinone reductase